MLGRAALVGAAFALVAAPGVSGRAQHVPVVWTILGRATRTPGADPRVAGALAGDAPLIGDTRGPTSVLPLVGGAYLVGLQHTVLRVDGAGRIRRFAGSGSAGWGGDGGAALAAHFGDIRDLARTPDGTVLVLDRANNEVRAIDHSGRVVIAAGDPRFVDGDFGGDGGPARGARLCLPNAVSALQSGGFLIADGCNHRVRHVSPDGRITTVAGRGDPGLDGDGGPATSAAIGTPISVQALADGRFVIGVEDADHERGAVRAVAADGRITTLAHFAAGSVAVLPDGDLVLARKAPRALLATAIVCLLPEGTVSTVAGSGRNPPVTVAPALRFDGDTEPARANAASITDLSVDHEGDVLYADSGSETSGIGGRVRLLPTGHSVRLAIGIKPATLRSPQRVRVAFALTRHAVVTAELRRGTRVLERVASSRDSLRQTLRFPSAVDPGRYEIRVIARTTVAPRQEAVDRITVFPGGVLTLAAARSIVDTGVRDANAGGAGFEAANRCHAFGSRRVDCAVAAGGICQYVDAVQLHLDGTLSEHAYRDDSPRCRFKERPHFSFPETPSIP